MIDVAIEAHGGTSWRNASQPDDVNRSRCDRATRVRWDSDPLKIAVVIITCRRPEVLRNTLAVVSAQSRRPDEIIVSAADASDVPSSVDCDVMKVVYGPRGACKQRNTAVANLSPDIDVIVFFDDDFLPHPRWIEAAERCFRERPTVDCLTGFLIADGIGGGGLSFDEGCDLIRAYRGEFRDCLQERFSPYGCNMAFRRSAVSGLAFDEKLVLYGWLEDRDFAATLARRGGRQIKTGTAVGVHLGVKRGRVSGLRLGYSQIVNPIYLFRKSNMSLWQLADHVLRNLLMNGARCLFPDGHVDRLGRLMGNFLGVCDVLRGIVEPERAENLVWGKVK